MTYTKICEHDGTEFQATREHARFCSGRCRIAWYRAHVADTGDVTRYSEYPQLGDDRFWEFMAALERGQLEHCLFEALWNVLPATAEGREWLGEIVAAQKSQIEAGATDEIVNDYVRHLFAHSMLVSTFARIWKIALQAGAETVPESTSTPGRSTAAVIAQIAELTGKLEARNPEAFMARVRADDREAVTAGLANSAETLRKWADSAGLF